MTEVDKKAQGDSIIVIGIAGASGSGKTTLVKNIADTLEESMALYFDDYKSDYNQLTEDLARLRKGKAITHPITNNIMKPKKYIIVEEPKGRTRKDMQDKIDLLIYINIPLEISLARVMIRSIIDSTDNNINSFYDKIGPQFESKYTEHSSKLLHILYWQLQKYIEEDREIYIKDHNNNLRDADFIVDGLQNMDKLAKLAVEKISTL